MKQIENSIDAVNLDSSVSYGEQEMASCDVQVNGQQVKEGSCSGKEVMEEVAKITKLSNGVHKELNSTTACNGNINGFYDDISDDDYQLVLESSSDDGSPVKKIDEDTISAPQIVQEIEDLLGINSNSVVIDDLEKETVNLSSTESVELDENEDTVETSETTNSIPQEIQDVFEGEETQEKKEKIKSQGDDIEEKHLNKPSERIECDSASNMNLVFDEVEIGADCIEIEEPRTASSIASEVPVHDSSEASFIKLSSDSSQSDEIDSNIESTNVDAEKLDKLDAPAVEVGENEKNKLEDKDGITVLENQDEIPLTQTSNLSDTSTEWMVIDSVESSDEEPKPTIGKQQNAVDSPCKDMNVDDSSAVQEHISTSVVSNEGDGTRKRCAPVDKTREALEIKRQKLEEKENVVESTTPPILKRQCSENSEYELKRTKLDGTEPELEPSVDTNKDKCLTSNEKQEQFSQKMPKSDSITTIDNNCMEINAICQQKSEKLTPGLCEYVNKSKDKIDQDIVLVIIEDGHKNVEVPSPSGSAASEGGADSKIVVSSDVVVEPVEDKKQSDEVDSSVQNEVESSESKVDPEKRSLDGGCEISQEITELFNNEVSTSGSIAEDTSEKSSGILSTNKKALVVTEPDTQNNSSEVCMEVDTADNKNKEHTEVSSIGKDCATGKALTTLVNFTEAKTEKKAPEVTRELSSSEKMITSNRQTHKVREETSDSAPIVVDKKSKDETKTHSSMVKGREKRVKKAEQVKDSKQKNIKSPFDLLTKHMQQQKAEAKSSNNLDSAIESVVGKSRSDSERPLPLLKKFHKDQLKKLTRSELEEAVVIKICEAVTDRSELGQLRLRCQTLEQNNELWRKKAMQFEKQNRELEMVLKRFLSEASQIKRDGQNKMALPIKVTRSVGLQVVLASSMHGALVTSKRVMGEAPQKEVNRTTSQQQSQPQQHQQPQQHLQQQQTVKKRVEKEPTKELQRSTATFTPPVQCAAPTQPPRRGRPAKCQASSSSSAYSTPTSSPSKVIVSRPSTPIKPSILTKTIASPDKDLEVIDLTDKDEKTRVSPQNTVGGSIRVAPSTQVCFVQQSPPTATPQPMAYLVQKTTTRPQFLMASTPSPTRPTNVVSARPPSAIALPVFRTGNQIIPIQPAPQVGVRTAVSAAASPRLMPKGIRVQSPTNSRHPAPLPPSPPPLKMGHSTSPPPKPQLKIAKTVNGIMLSWSMSLTSDLAEMASYQLYAYQEGAQPPSTSLWKKVGDVKALPLPMACTLTQFIEGHKYHFSVRAVDVHGRIGPFSAASSILLTK